MKCHTKYDMSINMVGNGCEKLQVLHMFIKPNHM